MLLNRLVCKSTNTLYVAPTSYHCQDKNVYYGAGPPNGVAGLQAVFHGIISRVNGSSEIFCFVKLILFPSAANILLLL